MKLTETIPTNPVTVQPTKREDVIRNLTSGRAGKFMPLAYVPMFREDRANGRVRVNAEMMETAETLMNAVNFTAYAYFVPFLALPWFNGLDQFNRSYMGQPEEAGGTALPFFKTHNYYSSSPFYKAMGIHGREGQPVNSALVACYNALWNHRARARSTKILLRDNENNQSLAQAFWKNPGMSHIVPDFDQAAIDGEVNLNLIGRAPVTGIGIDNANYNTGLTTLGMTRESTQTTREYGAGFEDSNSSSNIHVDSENGFPAIFAELAQANVSLSLSNIDAVKKTAAWAGVRKKYSGLSDEYIIDLLMQSIRVPDAQLAQPILLDRKSTIFGYSKRFASDAGNLDQSVTTGESVLELNIRTPAMNTGGIVMICAEIVPEEIYERQEDHFMTNLTVDGLPNLTRDFLDPEKVSVVQNQHVDVLHSDPDGTFGYAPLNHEWKRNRPSIGGKFFRVAGDPFNENRQRIWAVEKTDPVLTEDFYLVNDLHHKVFADTNADAFEITTLGRVDIIGNTVFGKGLEEDTGDFDTLSEQVDDTRIDQTA